MLVGNPFLSNPVGIHTAGNPIKLIGLVLWPILFTNSAASGFAPMSLSTILGIKHGQTGVMNTSILLKTSESIFKINFYLNFFNFK